MTEEQVPKNSKFNALKKLDYKIVAIVVLVVILLLVVLWHPWIRTYTANTRTVEVTGSATVKSTPDEFVFYPTYTSANSDKQAAVTELAKKSDDIVAKLKTLGVTDEMIKTNSSSSDGKYMLTAMYPMPGDSSNTLQITVTVNSRELAQKVQDYLGTTGPTAAVSPTPSFSAAKQKQLQSQARDQAAKDAKNQAEQMAKNLGFKLGPVKTVEDGAGGGFVGRGGIMPMTFNASAAGAPEAGAMAVDSVGTTTASAMPASGTISVSSGGVTTAAGPTLVKSAGLAVMPGQDQVDYSVTVVYYVK